MSKNQNSDSIMNGYIPFRNRIINILTLIEYLILQYLNNFSPRLYSQTSNHVTSEARTNVHLNFSI